MSAMITYAKSIEDTPNGMKVVSVEYTLQNGSTVQRSFPITDDVTDAQISEMIELLGRGLT